MIINRLILKQVHQGTLLTLMVLVSLSLFFVFIGELEDVGKGYYNTINAIEYVALLFPGKVVEFMPLAVLIGTILSLGSLASNSEIIAMQAAGFSPVNMLRAVVQAAFILALVSFMVADWVVPHSETSARENRSAAIKQTTAVRGKQGIWIKDEGSILHIKLLLPNGIAREIEIHTFDEAGNLVSAIAADSAIPRGDDWHLQQVRQTRFTDDMPQTSYYNELTYSGKISNNLLDALLIEPRQMSSSDLYTYIGFLQQNNLNADTERLTFWQKIFSPIVIIIMCILAVPFVLGSQRQGNAGQRLMLGILLGLCYVVVERLFTQMGNHFGIYPLVNAFLPGLLFLALAAFLLVRKIT